MLALAVTIVAPSAAQTPDADCQAGRERLAGHARASDAARRLVAARAGTTTGAPTAAPPGGRPRRFARGSGRFRASASASMTPASRRC